MQENVDFILHQKNLVRIQIYYRWNLIHADADDNKFSDTYFSANADLLVSNDRQLLSLNQIEFPHTRVMSLEDFSMQLLSK